MMSCCGLSVPPARKPEPCRYGLYLLLQCLHADILEYRTSMPRDDDLLGFLEGAHLVACTPVECASGFCSDHICVAKPVYLCRNALK